MATLRHDRRTGNWQVRFYWNGEQQERSCRTKTRSKALRTLASIEDTLDLLKSGRISIPDGVEPIVWIASGGKLEQKPKENGKPKDKRFGTVCDTYFKEQQDEGAKAATTRAAEQTHIGHLKRLIGRSKSIEAINLDVLKRYRSRRQKEKYRGNLITEALRRELATFRLIWIWAQDNEYVSDPCPLLRPNGRWRIHLPKPSEHIKFQSWQQIERRIKRGGLTDDEVGELWNSPYLDWPQVQELLEHVRQHAEHGFIYPMFAFAAYSGARRSEILRSQIDDIDFESDRVMIRERKRRKNKSASTRHVPLHPRLRSILAEWFQTGHHPGGQFTIATPADMSRRARQPAQGSRKSRDQSGATSFCRTALEHSRSLGPSSARGPVLGHIDSRRTRYRGRRFVGGRPRAGLPRRSIYVARRSEFFDRDRTDQIARGRLERI